MATINKKNVPAALLKPYLKKISLKSVKFLDDQKISEIFSLLEKEYKNKKISIVEFSKLGNFLYSKIKSDVLKLGELGKKLLSTSKVSHD